MLNYLLNRKKLILKLLTTVIAFSLIATFPNTIAETSENKTLCEDFDPDIIIPDDYDTIQEGINNANLGDKILIRSGIYYENLVIDKKDLVLQGENKHNTVIDGQKGPEDGIVLNAANIALQELTITNFNCEENMIWHQAGIKIYSPNCTIKNNILIKNQVGIHTYTYAYDLEIVDNNFIEDGILLADYFIPEGKGQTTEKDYRHKIQNNTVNGLPLYYIEDKNDFVMPADAGQIMLINCSNVTISNFVMSNNDFSMMLAFCSDVLIEDNIITDTDGEILLEFCENVTVQNNIIRNTLKAVCLEIGSKNNIVQNNEVSGNYVGLSIFNYASDNILRNNTVHDNDFAGFEIISYHDGLQKKNIIENNSIYNNKIGIHVTKDSQNNSILNNKIYRNLIGIVIQENSNGNKVEGNYFEKTLVSAVFLKCKENYFNSNYWGRPRILPKPIFGLKSFGNLFIPSITFDKNPLLI